MSKPAVTLPSLLWALAVFASAGCSIEPAGEPLPGDPAVEEGRIRFDNVASFGALIRHLNAEEARAPTTPLRLELSGFKPLQDTSGLPTTPAPLRAILDEEQTFQIGDEIHLLLGEREYVFPTSAEELIQRLRQGENMESLVTAGTLRVYGPERSRIQDETAVVPDESRSLLSAKYQYPFASNTHIYKFVDEAYVDSYSNYLVACFRAKFEYRKGSGWAAAGESVYKSITSARILTNAELLLSPTQSEGNTNLRACLSIVPEPGQCIDGLFMYATFVSIAPLSLNRETYGVNGEWTEEFANIRKCGAP